MDRSITVRATWDDEAHVFVAESDDIEGLATEAPTLEALRAKLEVMIPELIEENGLEGEGAVPVNILAAQSIRVARAPH